MYRISYCLHADQISLKLPAPHKRFNMLGLYIVLRSDVCFPRCCVYLIRAVTETSTSYADQLGKKLHTVDRSRSTCEKFCSDKTNCKPTPKVREMIVAKNVTADYFFVFLYYQNQGVQHDLTLVFDCLI